MKSFHVLVGPNASGKSTFLDVIAFLGQMVSDGLEDALLNRSRNFEDLTWLRKGNRFELAIEAEIPSELRSKLEGKKFDTVRYEVVVGSDAETHETGLLAERVSFKNSAADQEPMRELFPAPLEPLDTIVLPRLPMGTKTVIKKIPNRNDNFYAETGKSYNPSFKLGPKKSALETVLKFKLSWFSFGFDWIGS